MLNSKKNHSKKTKMLNKQIPLKEKYLNNIEDTNYIYGLFDRHEIGKREIE